MTKAKPTMDKVEKLTLKELAPYLPYKLRVMAWGKEKIIITFAEANSIGIDTVILERFKPILRPLSDLTKEIGHNGEKFVPDQELQKYVDANNGLLKYKKQDVYDLASCEYWIVEKLFEWKFDTHGLIEAGLAIDVNKLSDNPYK